MLWMTRPVHAQPGEEVCSVGFAAPGKLQWCHLMRGCYLKRAFCQWRTCGCGSLSKRLYEPSVGDPLSLGLSQWYMVCRGDSAIGYGATHFILVLCSRQAEPQGRCKVLVWRSKLGSFSTRREKDALCQIILVPTTTNLQSRWIFERWCVDFHACSPHLACCFRVLLVKRMDLDQFQLFHVYSDGHIVRFFFFFF